MCTDKDRIEKIIKDWDGVLKALADPDNPLGWIDKVGRRCHSFIPRGVFEKLFVVKEEA